MRRPAAVTILAVLNYLMGAYLFVGSAFGLLALWLGPFALVFWGVNALFFGLGYGLWTLCDLARRTQIVLSMIGAVGCLLLATDAVRDDFYVSLFFLGFTVLNVVIILYLWRPQVKHAFGVSNHSNGEPEMRKAALP